jgi:hypothetical protein
VFDQIYATLTESDKKELTKIEAKIGKFCDQQSEGEVRVFSPVTSFETLLTRRRRGRRFSSPLARVVACAIRLRRSSAKRPNR